MTGILDQVPELIEEGEKFTYDNFASKGRHGYPNAFSEDWLVWEHRLGEVVDEIGESNIADSIKSGLQSKLLGNDQDEFTAAKNAMLSGLKAAQRVFVKPIPAANRVVTLGHNSPEQQQALEKLDELVAAVEASNDFPGEPEDKEQVVAELSAGRRLLEAAKIRVSIIRAALQPSLKWIIEKAGGAIIGKLAGDLWQYLAHLHIF